MKLFDYIVGFIFILIIVLKTYLFPDVINKLHISAGLYTLNIVNWVVLFASICFIRFKIQLAKIFILLYVLLGYTESFWKYRTDETGIGFLIFSFIALTFFAFILVTWAKTGEDSIEEENRSIVNKSYQLAGIDALKTACVSAPAFGVLDEHRGDRVYAHS